MLSYFFSVFAFRGETNIASGELDNGSSILCCKTFNLFLKWFMNMSAKYSNASLNFIPANFSWDISVRFLSWECWDFWRRHDHFRRFLKKSEGLPKKSVKSSEDVQSLSKAKFSLAFHFKNQRSRGRYCYLFILHMVFVPYMGLS